METSKIIQGNCIDRLQEIDANIVDLVYFDPPFFTQKKHSLTNRENTKTYEFDDKYESLEEYNKEHDEVGTVEEIQDKTFVLELGNGSFIIQNF